MSERYQKMTDSHFFIARYHQKGFTKLPDLIVCASHLGRGSRAAKGIRL